MAAEMKKGELRVTSPSEREIDLEILPEKVEEERERIVAIYASQAKIAGFRKGKAPRDMIGRMFAEDIQKEIVDSLVPKVLEEELKGLRLSPVSTPVIQDLHFDEGQPLRCTVAFEVVPEFDLPDIDEIQVPKKEVAVGDSEIEQTLEDLRSRAAEYIPAGDRGVAEGDYVVLEIKGKDVRTKRFLPTEKTVVLAGQPDNDKALNENLMGLKAGEEKTFRVTYEEKHPAKKLAGKEIEYLLKVTSIKEKKLPDLNDDFAKSLGNFQSLDELKEKIRAELLASKEKAARSEMASLLLKEIAGRVSLDLPKTLVNQEMVAILRRALSSVPQAGLTPESVEPLKAEARKQAEANLKNHFILEKISEREGVTVSEEELQEEIKYLARANNVPLAQFADSLNQEGRKEDLKENLLLKKTVDILLKRAII